MKKYCFIYLATLVLAFLISCEKFHLNTIRNFLLERVENPCCSQIGGEWTIIALSESGGVPEEYKNKYLENLILYLTKNRGVLHDTKSSEFSRVIMALNSIGENPCDFNGFNLFLPLSDFEFTVKQGINGAIYCLLAVDCGNYDFQIIDDSENQNSRNKLIEYILSQQNKDGGFSVIGSESDPDITAYAIMALSKYRSLNNVEEQFEMALNSLKNMRKDDGFYYSFGEKSSESISAAINAFYLAGDVETAEDLCSFLKEFKKKGGYCHSLNSAPNIMATEQALIAMSKIYFKN